MIPFSSVLLAEYLTTAPDPVAEFSAPILKHMNDDHPETTVAMIKHYITGDIEVMFAVGGGGNGIRWVVLVLVVLAAAAIVVIVVVTFLLRSSAGPRICTTRRLINEKIVRAHASTTVPWAS